MAYMSQENKKKIAAELKKVIPATWKWSLAVHHHSSLMLTITSAPVDLIGMAQGWQTRNDPRPEYYGLNKYYLDHDFSGEMLATFEAIKSAMNNGNHDNSDSQTDYFDVGWYTDISLGRFGRPFTCNPDAKPAKAVDPRLAEIAELKRKIAAMEAAPKPKPAVQSFPPTSIDVRPVTEWWPTAPGNC
jgi:hypothetical protein